MKHEAKASNIKETAPKSRFFAWVERGLWRSKPRWMLMIGRHPTMATDVGEREEAKEGLYLGCLLRYSPWKRWPGGASCIMVESVRDKKNEVMGDA
jgi:hypothetical protein